MNLGFLKQINWGFSIKDIVYVGLIAVGIFFGYRMYTDLTRQIEDQKVAYKQLAENIARSSSEFVTKGDLNKFGDKISQNFDLMKKDIKKLGAEVVGINQTIAHLGGNTETDTTSDSSTTVDGNKEDFKKIKTQEGLPLAWAKYKLNVEKPWTVGTYPLEFHVNTILGKTRDDKLIPVTELTVVNTEDPETKGQEFKIEITESTFKQTVPTTMQFFKWAPHLDFGANAGATIKGSGTFGMDLGFSIAAYGRTKNDNLWRFGRVSFGLRDRFSGPQFTGSPIGYNLGDIVPLISDLWLYPTVSFGFGDTYGLGATISTTF